MDFDELKDMIFDEDGQIADDLEDRIIPLGIAALTGMAAKIYMNKRREEIRRRQIALKRREAQQLQQLNRRTKFRRYQEPVQNTGKIIEVEFEVKE